MKKHAWKLITLLAIVALLVTGVVFAVSAETESETPAVYKETSYKSEYVAASGSTAPAGWQINSVTPSGNLPAGAEYWDGNGNGLWVDFEYYYDSAYVKSATTIRMGGSTKGAIISISGGRITTTTNMAVGEKTVATLTTSGWHHIQAKITQEYDAVNKANLYYVQIWLNGVDCGTYQGKTSAWDANGWKLFTATPAGDGSVTYARASGYLY